MFDLIIYVEKVDWLKLYEEYMIFYCFRMRVGKGVVCLFLLK